MKIWTKKGFTLPEIMIVVAIIALLAAIAVPNLLRARVTSNEGAAIATMKAISSAAHIFRTSNSGYPALLSELYVNQTPPYIDSVLATGTKQGYAFAFAGTDDDGFGNFQSFTVTATPVNPGVTGYRYFFVDTTGVIRFNTAGDATENDDPIE
ncbi:MAG TPA: prepilin-type N-terminal cleavage/methylation domain-containing protein [Candidatus Omnitrophota bacterium]|nr:prepilin-type N-terminal cleavage/methylation domain-containing protein [Candidatus Omnitrophota bacterium]